MYKVLLIFEPYLVVSSHMDALDILEKFSAESFGQYGIKLEKFPY